MRIIDETYHDPGLPVQVFFETRDRSPRVLSPGDIIQFQSVTVFCMFKAISFMRFLGSL